MPVRIALPKGRLLTDTAALLEGAGWQLSGYDASLRSYRLTSARFPEAQIKVFQEKDIPVQVGIGNYDIGICGSDWIEELSTKYGSAAVVRIKDLGYARGALFVAGSSARPDTPLDGPVRIASEYPNIAETFALERRMKRFSVYPIWGAAEAYPPETATLALVPGSPDGASVNSGLRAVERVLDFSAFLIANRQSWEQSDLSDVLSSLEGISPAVSARPAHAISTPPEPPHFPLKDEASDIVRIALPDGHQQKHAVALLDRAGIRVDDYPSAAGNRRPVVRLEGVAAKVIRPQDMPLQVANGNFDLAITGKDWLTDHLAAFPSSPVRELADLKFGWVRIVAVVCNDVPADTVFALRQLRGGGSFPIRIASEYTNLADRYAREKRLGMYRVIPTWGATEAFLPEDADLLIENTETGSTIARHNLKILDTLFESTARLIGGDESGNSPLKRSRLASLVEKLAGAVEKK